MIEMEDLKPIIDPGASSVLTRLGSSLTEQSIKSYLVGGFVRDMLLGRETADIDIAVATDALKIAPEIAAAIGGKYFPLDEANGVGRIVLTSQETAPAKGRLELDIATLQGSIEQDLSRRDFTIDAMAIDLESIIQSHPQLIDPFGGLNDLRQRVIRAVSETAFESDAIRLLRAVRLAAELDFSIDKETESQIYHHADLLASVAGERVREELLRLLAIPNSGQLLFYLDDLGLLMVMFPEMAETMGVEQPKEHFWNVFDHSKQTVVALEFLRCQGGWGYASKEALAVVPWSARLAQHFDQEVSQGSTRRSLLKMSAFLHDVAKPQTKAFDEKGRMRFLGHAAEGAAIAVDILERLRFSTREIKAVETAIEHHLRPGQMGQNELPTNRAIYRYFRATGETGIDVLFLSLADHLATRGANFNLAAWQEHANMVDYVLIKHFEEEGEGALPKLVDGHDLINTFGMSPGPRVGEILEMVREAQAAGELTTREEALACIERSLLTSPPSPTHPESEGES